MPSVEKVRLPYEPLADYVRLNCQPPNTKWSDSTLVLWADRQMAAQIDVHYHTWASYKAEGIPFYSADAAAIRLGTHPCLIWPEWFDISVLAPPERVEHGNLAACAWHRNHKVPMCDECLPVERQRNRERMRARRAMAAA